MAFVTSSLDQWGASRQEVVATIAWVYGVRNTKFLYCFRSFNEKQERERETDRQTDRRKAEGQRSCLSKHGIKQT